MMLYGSGYLLVEKIVRINQPIFLARGGLAMNNIQKRWLLALQVLVVTVPLTLLVCTASSAELRKLRDNTGYVYYEKVVGNITERAYPVPKELSEGYNQTVYIRQGYGAQLDFREYHLPEKDFYHVYRIENRRAAYGAQPEVQFMKLNGTVFEPYTAQRANNELLMFRNFNIEWWDRYQSHKNHKYYEALYHAVRDLYTNIKVVARHGY
jgi:hypothetical protein